MGPCFINFFARDATCEPILRLRPRMRLLTNKGGVHVVFVNN
jgi:hypothetical protein